MNKEHPGVRISWIIKRYYSNVNNQLAEALGVTKSAIGNIVNEKTKPSFDVLQGILELHKEINPDWLIHGKEPQLRSDDPCWKVKQQNQELRQAIHGLKKIIKDF